MKCLVCNDYENDVLKRFSDHIRKEHGLDSLAYTVQFLCNGTRPSCPECRAETRYVAFSFKQYCKLHSKVAMSRGGNVGGKIKQTWSKGKTKETDERLAMLAEKQKGEGNAFWGREHTTDTRVRISQSKMLKGQTLLERVKLREHEFELVTDPIEYFSRQQQYLLFRCKACGTEQPKTLQAFERNSRCYVCEPNNVSNWEIEVREYVQSIRSDVVFKDRTLLKPKELDMWVPALNVAFECNGLYWHSDGAPDGTDPKYHFNKWRDCDQKGVKLVQFFADEWRDKQEIVKSLVSHRLKKLSPVGAREFRVSSIENKLAHEFFEMSHLAGSVPFAKCFGLTKDSAIVASLSLRKPRQQKYEGFIEVARFATMPFMHIPGGLSRLVKTSAAWAREQGYRGIMTYVDRRLGSGTGYEKAGFTRVGDTGIDFWYTDNICRYDRSRFVACDGKTEKQVAVEARVARIYGCGSWVFSMTF